MKIDNTLSLKNKAKGCLKGCGMVSAAIFCLFIIIAVIMSLIPDSSEDLHLKAIDLYKSGNYQKALMENNNAIKKTRIIINTIS